MTTKTDYHAVLELKANYTPAQRGVVTASEMETIRDVLEISVRSDIELQNVRNTAVMLYSRWADRQRQENHVAATMELMDAMSAVCCVIDHEKVSRGLPV